MIVPGSYFIAARQEKTMDIFAAIIDFLFDCHHHQLSRVFTIDGQTYQVCCDCGRKFKYSLESMTTERRPPRRPTLTWHPHKRALREGL